LNTPSHVLVNCAVLRDRAAGSLWLVVGGAALPDAPIFAFYLYEKLLGVSERQIWGTDYFVSGFQPVIDALHSFPLIAAALGVSFLLRSHGLRAFSASLLLHAAIDFLVHHEDAHRQLFPFSDYRFLSPVSYWDPRHYGAWGAGLELLCATAALTALVRGHRGPRARAAWIALWALDLSPFFYWAL
jgi:hypothetical protein